ncbi:MAG: signal protein PDZ [Acidobacteria bacterium]|nr:MAG: signal protein PDZ [Acidobacteriota bacterium]
MGDARLAQGCHHRLMNDILLSLSNQMADTVAAIAPSVVQVQGRRRPASGVVYAADVVLTTVRALGREDGLRVRTHDGRALDAELAGWDPATGLAVLRAASLGVASATAAETPARVGHLAIAVARSWSNALTASAGIVSVIGGPLPTGRGRAIDEVIRTTAPMHDGFAGGAFVDTSGRLTGIATAAEIRGLAVVIPYLGLAGQPVSLPDRQRGTDGREQALLVVGVTAGSPADAAGLLIGDVMLDFDGHPDEAPEDLLDLLVGDRVGTSVSVRVLRGAAIQELTIRVGERPAS